MNNPEKYITWNTLEIDCHTRYFEIGRQYTQSNKWGTIVYRINKNDGFNECFSEYKWEKSADAIKYKTPLTEAFSPFSENAELI